jgi:hypothetical protein
VEVINHRCPFFDVWFYTVEERTSGKCRVEKLGRRGLIQISRDQTAKPGISRHSAFCRLCRARHKRHTFAVECLLGWYRQGQEELNAKILSLAVYLGHRNIRHTYWYLSAVPELLALGSARWAKALNSQKGAAHE